MKIPQTNHQLAEQAGSNNGLVIQQHSRLDLNSAVGVVFKLRGLAAVYVVKPVADQSDLVEKLQSNLQLAQESV